MKAIIAVVAVVVVAFVVVKVLGSTQGDAEYPQFDAGVRGPLEINAVSVADEEKLVGRTCERPFTAKQKAEHRVGVLRKGETFKVLNHFQNGIPLWVYIQSKDRPELKGWLISEPDSPFHAHKIN
jgi:hypothetical protein